MIKQKKRRKKYVCNHSSEEQDENLTGKTNYKKSIGKNEKEKTFYE